MTHLAQLRTAYASAKLELEAHEIFGTCPYRAGVSRIRLHNELLESVAGLKAALKVAEWAESGESSYFFTQNKPKPRPTGRN